MAIRRPNDFGEIDAQYVKRTGMLLEITREIYVDARGAVYLIWELIKGYIFTKSNSAIQTKSGSMIMCKNQKK